MAEGLQTALVEGVDPENHREAKGNTSYYLLKRQMFLWPLWNAAFLSNPEEAGLLATKDIRKSCRGSLYRYLKVFGKKVINSGEQSETGFQLTMNMV